VTAPGSNATPPTARRVGRRAVVGVVAAMSLSAALVVSSVSVGATPPATTQWLGYHGGGLGTGLAVGIRSVDTSAPRWTSRVLDGQVYGEPLVYGHDVIVATENDSVYALSSANGAVVWRRHLARAVSARLLPCGNITPEVGITGTPVIDPARDEVFVLDFEMDGSTPRHYVYGLDLSRGAVDSRVGVPPPTPDQTPYLNRSGLAIDRGSVVYSYGGNYGDCGTYHGVVGSISEVASVSPHPTYVVDDAPGQREGAVWMAGAAPVVDAAGHVWVATGNGSVTSPGQPYDHSDAVLELSSSMRLTSYFAPTSWYRDNAADADLSASPALLGNGLVVATGKSGVIYLLRARHLGHVGGQVAAVDSRCGDVLDGGVVVHGSIVYLPCRNGTEAVRVSAHPASITVIWHADAGAGPPIMAAQLVWSIADGVLYGLDPDNGHVERHISLGVEANSFPTPSVGAGLLLAPLARQVMAFTAR
jgi:outer membrane protein assembly factor BamB